MKIKWTQGGASKINIAKKCRDQKEGQIEEEEDWEIMSEGEKKDEKKDEKKKKKKRGKKPELSQLGQAVVQGDSVAPILNVHPAGKSVLSDETVDKGNPRFAKIPASKRPTPSISDADSGVLHVEVLKRSRGATNEGEDGTKEKKKKRKKDHEEKRSNHVQNRLTSQARAVSVGAGGASSW